ncbi:MAG: putative F0F1-ATPase subunit Ca2+/Mg2+ transporter [Cyanobacteria bacterium RYN_339]|nr:putative F0F1-ATPase subunit Ca2+/Mg2+ transporter [Cyanobacteria bacterium RYN_339]
MRGFSAAYGLLVAILVGAGLGFLVDSWTHHGPLALLAGTFLGFGAGLYSLYQAMMADSQSRPPADPNVTTTPDKPPEPK